LRNIYLILLLLVGLAVSISPGGAQAPAELDVYTYASFPTPLVDNIKSYFQKSKVTVRFKTFSDTGPLFNQLLQEAKAPRADVVIGLDHNYLTKAVKKDLLQAYRPKAASAIKKDLIFDSRFRLTPFDFGYIVFNYDSEKLEKVPKTFRDLLNPCYKGKIIIENPLTSSPGQAFLLTTVALYGEKGYLDYWKSLKRNLLTITPGWDEAYGMYTSGEAPIVLSYGTSPVYHLLYDKTERYKALVLDNAAYAQIEGAGIVKGARHLQNARLLIEYILAPEFQKLIPENQFMYPVRNDLALPPSFRVAAKVDRLLNLPAKKVENQLDRWLSDWEKIIRQ
jgi:thiamine transport system substrate-binding protein